MYIKKIFIILLLFTKISYGMDYERIAQLTMLSCYKSFEECLTAIEKGQTSELDYILKINPVFEKMYIAKEFSLSNPVYEGKPTNLLALALFDGNVPCISRIIQSHSQYQADRYNNLLKEGKSEQSAIALLKNENRPAYLHIFLMERTNDFVGDTQSQELFTITQSLIDNKLAFADDIVDSWDHSNQYVSSKNCGTSLLHIPSIPIAIMNYLMTKGAQRRINFGDKHAVTPLNWIATDRSEDSLEKIKLLIKNGADPKPALMDTFRNDLWDNATMLLDHWPTGESLPTTIEDIPGYLPTYSHHKETVDKFLHDYKSSKQIT